MFTLAHNFKEDNQKRYDTITWTLLNIMHFLEKNKNKYKEFRIDKHKDLHPLKTNFNLKIKCLGISNDVLEIFYLFPKSVVIKSKLHLRKTSFNELSLADNEYHDIQSNKWMYLATLFKKDISDYVLNDKSLRLVFTFEIMTNVMVLENIPKGELSNDLHNLLDCGLYSDVIIKSADGKEFNVHKAILAGRSAVLKAHFDHNTLECHTNIVESPFETDILNEVLIFIYSDKSPRVDDFPEKLLHAADFYQLDELKKICEQALQENLSVDNAIKTLELAELHRAERLKNLILQFIKDGHSKDIIRTEGWAQIESKDIIKSIFEYIIDVKDEVEEKSYEQTINIRDIIDPDLI